MGNQPTTLTDPSGLEPPQLTSEQIDEIINTQPTIGPLIGPRGGISLGSDIGIQAGAFGPGVVAKQQARLSVLLQALTELESILIHQTEHGCLPRKHAGFLQREYMQRRFPSVGRDAEWSEVVESIRYTRTTYTEIGFGAGHVHIKEFGTTSNMPGLPGLEIRRDEFFNTKAPEVALINFVHEANHDWCRYGFEPYDHVTKPMSTSGIGKLTRSLQKYIDWVETHVDPFTGTTLLQHLLGGNR